MNVVFKNIFISVFLGIKKSLKLILKQLNETLHLGKFLNNNMVFS